MRVCKQLVHGMDYWNGGMAIEWVSFDANCKEINVLV